MIARGDHLEHDGKRYTIPAAGGRGKPIRSMAEPVEVPMFVAALGPSNLRMTGAVADGWIGNAFMPETAEVYLDALREGADETGRSLCDIEIVIPVALEVTDDVDEAVARHAAGYAFTLGAMGPRDNNFYVEAFAKQGFDEQVREVQSLWLDGRRDEARAAVPHELGERTNLLGTPELIRARLERYRDAGVDTLLVKMDGDVGSQLDRIEVLLDLARDLDPAG